MKQEVRKSVPQTPKATVSYPQVMPKPAELIAECINLCLIAIMDAPRTLCLVKPGLTGVASLASFSDVEPSREGVYTKLVRRDLS